MFKPMLASEAKLDKLTFPLITSAKLDGVRAVVIDGVVMSRSLKPIPSEYVQEKFGHLEGFDGELIVGDPTSPSCYRDTMSNVMSKDKWGFAVKFYVFDHIQSPDQPYVERAAMLQASDDVVIHRQIEVHSLEELMLIEDEALQEGHEGLILRSPSAPYKHGRSTAREGYLLKLKRFTDAEAVVVGSVERMHNGNEATTNELGRTQRSTCKAGKTGHGDLGALVVEYNGVTFNIGTGFTAEERQQLWGNRNELVGKICKFKHFTVGAKEAPRHPVFLGWRSPLDMSN